MSCPPFSRPTKRRFDHRDTLERSTFLGQAYIGLLTRVDGSLIFALGEATADWIGASPVTERVFDVYTIQGQSD